MRGYKKGRFSFNVKGGRCEACRGDGIIKIEMHFCLMSMFLVKYVMANDITLKHQKYITKEKALQMFWK